MAAPVISAAFTGGKELIAAFAELPKGLAKTAVTAAMKDVVDPMVADMQSAAPKRTGEAAASIQSEVKQVEGYGLTVAVGPDRDHFYLAFSEWGTAHQPARAWMRPVWDSHRAGILKQFGAAIWESLAAAAGKLAAKAGS